MKKLTRYSFSVYGSVGMADEDIYGDFVRHKDVKELIERMEDLEDAMQTFVTRVEEGSIRSRKTYAQFKSLLENK